MCGILRWRLQFIAQKPIFFGLFQEEVNDFYLPDLNPVLKRKQSTLSMYLNGIAAWCFCFVFFIQSNAQQGILGLEDGWTADFNKSKQLNCQRSSRWQIVQLLKHLPPQPSDSWILKRMKVMAHNQPSCVRGMADAWGKPDARVCFKNLISIPVLSPHGGRQHSAPKGKHGLLRMLQTPTRQDPGCQRNK